MKPSVLFSLMTAILLVVTSGCGKTTEWPSSEGDYARITADRGMAKLWGVIIVVEGAGGETVEKSISGDVGTGPEDANAQYDMTMGEVTLRLETTGTKQWNLFINEKAYGKVKSGHRVRIAEDRTVYVNDEERK